jgi:hypothetical protein
MTRCESLNGPIYFAHAVVTDRVIQVAVITANMRIAINHPHAGWNAIQYGFSEPAIANRYARRKAAGELD